MSDPSHRAHSVQTQQPAPEMIRFRDLLADAYGQHPPLHTLSIQAARAVAEIVRAPWASGGPTMLETRDHLIESGGLSLRLRVHRPKQEPDGVLVYVHGGGWTLFSMDTHDRVMREYAGRAGIAVVGIDYTLVPEAVFPRQVDEVTALVRLLRQPDAQDWLGFDPIGLPIAIGGDSAGGNLAMATALTLRDAGEIDYLQAVILNYAVVDTDETRPSYRRYGGPEFNLTEEEMRGFWDGYALDPAVRQDPRAALLRGTLSDLPPTYFTIAECDVLLDENLALAAALQVAGVPVRSQIYPGMLHSFLEAVSISPTSARAFQETSTWLRGTFGLD